MRFGGASPRVVFQTKLEVRKPHGKVEGERNKTTGSAMQRQIWVRNRRRIKRATSSFPFSPQEWLPVQHHVPCALAIISIAAIVWAVLLHMNVHPLAPSALLLGAALSGDMVLLQRPWRNRPRTRHMHMAQVKHASRTYIHASHIH